MLPAATFTLPSHSGADAEILFDLFNDVTVLDEEGMHFVNIDAAHMAAVTNIRDLMCADVQKGKITLHHRIEVKDSQRRKVLTVFYADAVQVAS